MAMGITFTREGRNHCGDSKAALYIGLGVALVVVLHCARRPSSKLRQCGCHHDDGYPLCLAAACVGNSPLSGGRLNLLQSDRPG